MKRRIIKIEKRELHINQMNTIMMQSRQERSIKIMRVYYISDLNANLLSCKRLCMLKLKDRFDMNAIYFYKNHKNMLKTDHHKNIYILIWIFNKFFIEIEIVSKQHMLLQAFSALKHNCYERILLSPIAYSALLLPSVVQGLIYKSLSLIHSFLNLLSSLYTFIWSQTLCWFWHYNKSSSYTHPMKKINEFSFFARSKRSSLIKNTLSLSIIQTSLIQKNLHRNLHCSKKHISHYSDFQRQPDSSKNESYIAFQRYSFSLHTIKFPRTKSTIT